MSGLIKDGRGRPVTRVDRTQVVLSISRSVVYRLFGWRHRGVLSEHLIALINMN